MVRDRRPASPGRVASVVGLFVFGLIGGQVRAGIHAGAAEAEITPPVGLEIQHFFRQSEGVHDPLFARCVVLQDDAGGCVAIVCLDLILGSFEACDALREEIRQRTGIDNTLINFSHSHSSAALGPRGQSAVSNDYGSRWNDGTLDAIIGIVAAARSRLEPVTLSVGRATVEVGFNRRKWDPAREKVVMQVNREGPSVPWVNVLVAKPTGRDEISTVLFETAAHPVVIPHTTNRISADFPGAAVALVKEELGPEVIAMFGQGCGGNVNAYPLRSSYERALHIGRQLGRGVVEAVRNSVTIEADALDVRQQRTALPSHPLPTSDEVDRWMAQEADHPDRIAQLERIDRLLRRGGSPPPRRLDVSMLSLGQQWCLVALPHEMFCEYELWINQHAPFDHTMTFAYTNGYEGYIAVDEALRLGPAGGYEAASLPNWGGQVKTRHFGPPAVGCERIIKKTISSLWHDAPETPSPAGGAASEGDGTR
ncbi:hypothetical protein [Botrimarina sp.]|uniref:hypothetical protein n=1 Tax=Botrimarina sp. TaxID=2795802 RepID=UPI0032ED4B55